MKKNKMALVFSAFTTFAASAAFAYTTGTYECGKDEYKLKYEVTSSGIADLPVMTVSNARITHKGLAKLTETKNAQGEVVEILTLVNGGGRFDLQFVDGHTNCMKTP